jgi:hypothetical protein
VAVIDTEVSGRWFSDQAELHAGDLMATLAVTRRHDLTDAQWAALEPLLLLRNELDPDGAPVLAEPECQPSSPSR